MIAPSTQLLLDRINPRSRIHLVVARRSAMQGKLDVALTMLDDKIAALGGGTLHDLVAFAMLKAELLLLDGHAERAMEVFDRVLMPRLNELPPEVSFVIEHNYHDVNFALPIMKGEYSVFHLGDRQRLVGFELVDTSEIVATDEDAAEDKHFRALPALWRELVRTHRQACWTTHRWAAKRMARECLRIGLPQEAVYHVAMAQDDKLAREVGDNLEKRRDHKAIRHTITKLTSTSNLKRHFGTACEILGCVADAIPDDQIDYLAEWLLPRCSIVPVGSDDLSTLRSAWQTLKRIGRRVSPELAAKAIEIAVNNPQWTTTPNNPSTVFLAREHIVGTVNQLIYAVPRSQLGLLARQSLPLAKERMQHNDYARVIKLLCQIAERGGNGVKDWIADQLFEPDKPVTYLLGQVAMNFGKQFLPVDRLARAADEVATNLSLQVQRLALDEEPKPVPGGFMTHVSPRENGKIVVTLMQGVELGAMAIHHASIPPEHLQRLIESAAAMIADPENFLSNRTVMIHAIMDIGPGLPQYLADTVLRTLTPLARGEIEEPSSVPPAAMANDPLNPFKIRTGNPAELRGVAIWALAKIGKHYTKNYGPELHEILEDALGDLDPEVRRFAFAAARDISKLSEAATMAVLLGTRDADPNAAASAFAALATKAELRLTRSQWQQFIYATKMASQSPIKSLRRTAAGALCQLIPMAPSTVLRTKANDLLTLFASDICASVREATSANRE